MTQPNSLETEKIISTNSFNDFIKSVRSFCCFIENDKTEEYITFLRLIQSHLHSLYSGGQNLQHVDLNYNLDFQDLVPKLELEKYIAGLSNKLLNRFYWHVFDPTKEDDIEPVCGDLLDDLGDIYKELKNCLLLYDNGSSADIETAVWTFKWSFDNHWGEHCINATYALHYFIRSDT